MSPRLLRFDNKNTKLSLLVLCLPLVALGGLALPTLLAGDPLSSPEDDIKGIFLFPPGEHKWKEAPDCLPKGAQIAVLEGDPSKEGPFVFRLKVPSGYRIPPHTHPMTERVTVLAGTFHIGMGSTFNEKRGSVMPAGCYGFWMAGMKHYVWAEGETILQFHGIGPWSIKYVNPQDDPRNQGK